MLIHFVIISCLSLFLLLWSENFYLAYKQSESRHLKIVVCLIFACLFKFDWGIHFLGLEYEDAYSFSAYTRQLSFGIISDSLRIECIDIGSLEEPQSLGTYGGHYVTYPIFLYLFTTILGFSITNISIINSFVSFLSLLTLAFYKYPYKYSWILAVSLFCFAPAINLFSTCFLAESFSAYLNICFILCFFISTKQKSTINAIFVYVTFFLCILTKRDNMILFVIPCVYSLHHIYSKNYKLAVSYVTPYIIIFSVSLLIHNFLVAEYEEGIDISQSTFSISIFKSQFPVYIKSLCSMPYYSICFYIFILLLIFDIIQRRITIEMSALAILLVASLFMYSTHYRGYYFIENLEEFNAFATFRYINNFFYIIPIYIALSLNLTVKYMIQLYICLNILGIFSADRTLNLRLHCSREEQTLRFNELKKISQIITDNDVIITDVPLLLLNVQSPSQIICNIQRISDLNIRANYKFYIFCDELTPIINRYHLDFPDITLQHIKTFPSGKKLYLVKGY